MTLFWILWAVIGGTLFSMVTYMFSCNINEKIEAGKMKEEDRQVKYLFNNKFLSWLFIIACGPAAWGVMCVCGFYWLAKLIVKHSNI